MKRKTAKERIPKALSKGESMNQEYEEWEIEASEGKKKWIVCDTQLPTCSKDKAEELCRFWSEYSPRITYAPVGYKVSRQRLKA